MKIPQLPFKRELWVYHYAVCSGFFEMYFTGKHRLCSPTKATGTTPAPLIHTKMNLLKKGVFRMRNRNINLHIRLTQSEYDKLCCQAERAGLKKSTYLRFLMQWLIPQDKPAPEFRQTLEALYRIGNDLSQLTAIANAKGWLHVQRLDKALEDFRHAIVMLTEQQLPQKADVGVLLEYRKHIADKEEISC